MLKRWSGGNGIGERVLKDVEWWITQCGRSTPSIQQTDIEFFDLLCRFHFGCLPDNHNFVYDLLSCMHIWVSLYQLHFGPWQILYFRIGPKHLRVRTLSEQRYLTTSLTPNCFVTSQSCRTANRSHPLILDPLGLLYVSLVLWYFYVILISIYSQDDTRMYPRWEVLQPSTVGYVIIGHGSKSGLACYYQKAIRRQVIFLNSFVPPTAAQISRCRGWFEEMG